MENLGEIGARGEAEQGGRSVAFSGVQVSTTIRREIGYAAADTGYRGAFGLNLALHGLQHVAVKNESTFAAHRPPVHLRIARAEGGDDGKNRQSTGHEKGRDWPGLVAEFAPQRRSSGNGISLLVVDRLDGNEVNVEVIRIVFDLGIDQFTLIGIFDLGIASCPPVLVLGFRCRPHPDFGRSVHSGLPSSRTIPENSFKLCCKSPSTSLAISRASSSSIARNAMTASPLISAT
jgi:hypothetical protein